jgi:integrase
LVSAGTVNRELTILSHAIETARREWGIYMPDNPVQRVRRLRAPLDAVAAAVLRKRSDGCWRRASNRAGSSWCQSVKLALETAMRRGEIVRIERKHDRPASNSVLVLPDTKNGSPRPVPLSECRQGDHRKVLVDMPRTAGMACSSPA